MLGIVALLCLVSMTEHACACMCLYLHTYILTYLHTYMCMYVYVLTYLHTYMCMYVYVLTYLHTYILTCACMYVLTCACMCLYFSKTVLMNIYMSLEVCLWIEWSPVEHVTVHVCRLLQWRGLIPTS